MQNPKPLDTTENAAIVFLQSFAILVINSLHECWFSTHDVWQSVEDGYARLGDLLNQTSLVTMSVRDATVFLNDRRVISSFHEVVDFGAHLAAMGVAAVSFTRGITKEEYAQFADLMATPVATLRRAGGIDAALTRLPVDHITILMGTDYPEPAPAQQPVDRRRVLLVDDDANLSTALCVGLTEYGFDVRAENDSRNTLARVRDFMPDIIVLDISMPHLDGGDVAQQLGEQPDISQIPIIFLTSIVTSDEAASMTELGQTLMAKPVNIAALAAQINRSMKARPRY